MLDYVLAITKNAYNILHVITAILLFATYIYNATIQTICPTMEI